MDFARTLAPMFLLMLTPVLIPAVVALVGGLSDAVGRRSRRKRPASASYSRPGGYEVRAPLVADFVMRPPTDRPRSVS